MSALFDAIRPVFLDGERLSARRLNGAFEYLRSNLRRVLLGPLSPGVAIGLAIGNDDTGDSLLVSPGVAIDGRGRVIVVTDSIFVSRGDIETELDGLDAGDVVRIGIGLSDATSPLDPCTTSGREVEEKPKIYLRKLAATGGATRVDVGRACVDPWGDLDAVSSDLDGCSVRLGTLGVVEESGFLEISMDSRQGIAPRFDALRNSYDEVVAELRARGGTARAYFVAPAGGTNVQATHVARDIDGPAAARAGRSGSPRVLEISGGTPTGSLAVGFGGVAAIPIERDGSDGGGIAAGVCLELVREPASAEIAVERYRGSGDPLFGLAAGPPYSQEDASGARHTVVPLAVAGVLEVNVPNPPELEPLIAGAPLTAEDATTLRAARSGETVIAVMARSLFGSSTPGTITTHVFVVHPPYTLP